MVDVLVGLLITIQDVGFCHASLHWFVRLTNLRAQEGVQSPAEAVSDDAPSSCVGLTSAAF